MQALDLPIAKDSAGKRVHRRRYLDDVECASEGTASDFRRAALLEGFVSQKDLWRLPALGLFYSTMSMVHISGRWTITIERTEVKQ